MSLLRDIVVGALVVALQVTIFRHLRVFGLEPDVTLILLFWWMTLYSRTRVLLLAFLIGFLQDMMMDWWGLTMFAKTSTVMILHGFLPKREDNLPGLSSYTFYLSLCVLLHQVVLVVMAEVSALFSVGGFLGLYLIGNSVFTVLIGVAAYILSGRRYG